MDSAICLTVTMRRTGIILSKNISNIIINSRWTRKLAHLFYIPTVMTHDEVLNTAGSFLAEITRLIDDLRVFSDSVGEYSNELPIYWRDEIRYLEQDADNIANHLRRAKDRLSFDLSQLRII